MVVEDHDGGHDAGGHHEHDAVEICACGEFNWIGTDWVQLPSNGLSEVIGMISTTMFRNTVRDIRIVIPG